MMLYMTYKAYIYKKKNFIDIHIVVADNQYAMLEDELQHSYRLTFTQ